MDKKYTYFIKSKYFPESFIDAQFKARGNWIKHNGIINKSKRNPNPKTNPNSKTNPNPIDFIYLDELFYTNPRYYLLPSKLKNTVNDNKREISFKHNFVRNMLSDKIGKKYVMLQHEIDLMPLYKNPSASANILENFKDLFTGKTVYIFKPITGKAGSDIAIFNKYENLVMYCNQIIKRNGHIWDRNVSKGKGKDKGKDKDELKDPLRIWVLQEYISNPLLIKKEDGVYKFHIRQAYLYQPNKLSYYRPLDICPAAVAEKPFIYGDWSNKDIHDTHFHGKIDYNWSMIINMIPSLKGNQKVIEYINAQIHEIYTIINKYIHADCYSETKHCFELFGSDIMITDTFDVKIIEINSGLGISGDILQKQDIFENILTKVVDIYYPPKNKIQPPKKLFIPIQPQPQPQPLTPKINPIKSIKPINIIKINSIKHLLPISKKKTNNSKFAKVRKTQKTNKTIINK